MEDDPRYLKNSTWQASAKTSKAVRTNFNLIVPFSTEITDAF